VGARDTAAPREILRCHPAAHPASAGPDRGAGQERQRAERLPADTVSAWTAPRRSSPQNAPYIAPKPSSYVVECRADRHLSAGCSRAAVF